MPFGKVQIHHNGVEAVEVKFAEGGGGATSDSGPVGACGGPADIAPCAASTCNPAMTRRAFSWYESYS